MSKKSAKNDVLVKQWKIPIYGCRFTFVVFADEKSIDNSVVNAALKTTGWEWGEAGSSGFHVCNPRKGRFCIAMLRDGKGISIEVLTHEVFHLTHRVIEWSSGNFDADHHEQAAFLNGYLNEALFRFLYYKKIPLTFEKR